MIACEAADEAPLVSYHSGPKSQLWCIILNVMHVLKLRSVQCLVRLACGFYGHTIQYGCTGTVDSQLKKEMGLLHVNEDYKHRKQEHNSLENTDVRKCMTQEGRRWVKQSILWRARDLLLKD